jgi:hypothetical protein
MTDTLQTQLVPGLSLTRFENPLSVTLTDPDGHALLRPAGSAGAGHLLLSLRNTASRELTFLSLAAGAGHLTLVIRRAALDPAVIAAGGFAVTGQGGTPALAQAVWSGQVLPAPMGADWVTLRLSARLAAATPLPAGSDLTLRLALCAATGSGARGAQVTVATDPTGIHLGDTGLDSNAILHLSLMAGTGTAGAGPLAAVFRGPLGDRLLPGDAGHDLTLNVTAAATDVAAFRQFAGQGGTRPMQLRLSLPPGVLLDGVLPPANATATLSDDGSGVWRITLAASAYPVSGPLDLSFTLQKLRCDSATPLGPLDLTLDALDLPTPDQVTQRLTARLMVSGMTEGSAIPPSGGTAIGVVQMFGTANQFFKNGDASLGNTGVRIGSGGQITTAGNIAAGSITATSATLYQGLTAASVKASDSIAVAGVTLNGTHGRNTFHDIETTTGAGLRVGAAWSMPGIYAEDATCVVGGKTGVNIQNGVITVAATDTPPLHPSISVDSKGGVNIQNGVITVATSDTPDLTPSISVDKKGGVHIGGTRGDQSPTFASLNIHKTPISQMELVGGFRYLDGNGVGIYRNSWSASYALWAEGRIFTSDGINVVSDARMKQVVAPPDPARDLDLISRIEVMDYRLVTQSPDDPTVQRKVIAQQVETIYPQAVSRNPGEVPDIRAGAECHAGWITLPNDLTAGDRVRILRDGGKTDGVETVTEATPDGFRTETPSTDGAVFVYGRAVDDLRAVDYDALSMLTLSATKALKTRVETLEADLAAARDDIARLSAHVAALLARGQP